MAQETTAAIEIISHSPAETRRIGRHLGKLLQPGDLLLLEGPFGAGKTVLTQGIAKGAGVEEVVSSPSFTLINEYQAGKAPRQVRVYHADLYRIHGADEALALGLDEYLAGRGIFIAEWPENVAEVWPSERLWIRLRLGKGDERIIDLDAQGMRYVQLLGELERELRREAKG